MKKICFVSFFLFLIAFSIFGNDEDQEEIDHLLFLPNSSSQFVNEEQAAVQLDNLAKYFLGRNIASGQINVYGYSAVASNDIEPVTLSRNRAIFVINELQRRGVPRSLFSDPVGYGEVDLWGSNASEEEQSPNRRVRVVLDGNVLVLQQSTGQVIESEVLSPAAPEIPEPEIIISSIEIDETVIESGSKFPWWILFPLLLLLSMLVIFAKLRKSSANKTPKPEKVKPPTPVPAAGEKAVPAAAPVAAGKKAAPAVEVEESVVYLEEEIRSRAYELYLQRNGQSENEYEDWCRAVIEVCGKYEAAGYQTYSDGSWWARKTFSRNI